MTWPDLINGTYELAGGLFILLSIIRLYHDKQVHGVSVVHVGFFTSWGFWNLFYYPSLNQWWSFIGGLGVVAANSIWVFLLLYYTRRAEGEIK